MNAPKISVIVPVYNTEQYLNECIDSILKQSFRDFELILVDDGSTDQSGMICDAYGKNDPRVVVIHQKNAGAASARNRGLDAARGDYIAFIDSDDAINSSYLQKLYHAIMTNQADISICQWNKSYNNLYEDEKANGVDKVMSGREISIARFDQTGEVSVAPWSKLISRILLKNLRFPEGKYCEDQAVIPYVLYSASRVALIRDKLYYYRIRSDSASNGSFSARFFDNIEHMDNYIAWLKKQSDIEMVARARHHRNNTLARYNIVSLCNNIEIPPQYKMNEIRAWLLFRKITSNDKFSWFLSRVHPSWVLPFDYLRKIESIITGKPL